MSFYHEVFMDNRNFNIEDMKKWNEYVKLQREMGKKDWEIF